MSAKLNRILKWVFGGVPVKQVRAEIRPLDPSRQLDGKTILITGGGRGLGYEMARKFFTEGARVILCGRNEETLRNASRQLGGCPYLVLDVSRTDLFEGIFDRAAHLAGSPVQILVNNAGISLHEYSFEQVTENDFDRQFGTNLRGPYFLSQEFIRYRHRQASTGPAQILFISSERGFCSDTLPYGLTKAALNSLAQGLAKKYIREGIRVNAIAPGVTASDMTQMDKAGELYREDSIADRALVPEEIAQLAVFLLSDASSCLNGVLLPGNLGNHIR